MTDKKDLACRIGFSELTWKREKINALISFIFENKKISLSGFFSELDKNIKDFELTEKQAGS